MLSKSDFAIALRDELNNKATLDHPIFDAVMGQEANWPLLREMALQGFQLTANFLEYVETLFFYCPHPKHKKRLLFNLFEEETGRLSRTKNHVTLMKDFMTAIGLTEEDRQKTIPTRETQELIDYRMALVKNRETYHMGAAAVMIASEGQNLETRAGEGRSEVLPRLYGLTEKDLLFFSVHQKEDIGHVKEGIDLVVDLCTTEKMQNEAIYAVRKTCDLFIAMYGSVYQKYQTSLA